MNGASVRPIRDRWYPSAPLTFTGRRPTGPTMRRVLGD